MSTAVSVAWQQSCQRRIYLHLKLTVYLEVSVARSSGNGYGLNAF
jgi:hypothetical protein